MSAESKHKLEGAMYLWRDSREHAIQSSRAIVYGNGSMYFDKVVAPDSNTYYCDVHLSDNTKRTHIHTVIGLFHYIYAIIYINWLIYGCLTAYKWLCGTELKYIIYRDGNWKKDTNDTVFMILYAIQNDAFNLFEVGYECFLVTSLVLL